MPRTRTQLRGVLDRKVMKLSRAGKLKGRNLDRVLKRTDLLAKPKPPSAQPARRRFVATEPPRRVPQTRADRELLRQGFTAKELGIPLRRKK